MERGCCNFAMSIVTEFIFIKIEYENTFINFVILLFCGI